MQKDYTTTHQRKSSYSRSAYKALRPPNKFKQAIYWVVIGLCFGLIATYLAKPKSIQLAATNAEATAAQKEPQQKEEKATTVIQLELP